MVVFLALRIAYSDQNFNFNPKRVLEINNKKLEIFEKVKFVKYFFILGVSVKVNEDWLKF